MKRIVILTCLKASRVCTGAACFQAFNQRTRSFARYGKEPLEIEAFMRCSGCRHTLENDRGLQKKGGADRKAASGGSPPRDLLLS